MENNNGIDAWEIKMLHNMTLWGVITPKIESIVARYSSMIDNEKNINEKKEIEHEFIVTMYSHGIICD